MSKPILIDTQLEKAQKQINDMNRGIQKVNDAIKFRNSIAAIPKVEDEQACRKFVASPLKQAHIAIQATFSSNPQFPDEIDTIFKRQPVLDKKAIYNNLSGGFMNMSEMGFKNGFFYLPEEKEKQIIKDFEVWAESDEDLKLIKEVEQLCKVINDHRTRLGKEYSQNDLFGLSDWLIDVENTGNGFQVVPSKQKLIQYLANR